MPLRQNKLRERFEEEYRTIEELFLYIVNTGAIYNHYTIQTIKTIQTTKPPMNKVVDLFYNLAETGSREFGKEIGFNALPTPINPFILKHVVNMLHDYYFED